MSVRAIKRLFVGTLLLAMSCSIGSRQAKADGSPETMDLSAIGSGPNGSESINGTFQFNPTNGTFSDGNLVGSGLISETWTFGTEAGTAEPGVGAGYYSLSLSNLLGSQGDNLFFVMLVSASGGDIPPNAGGGGPNLFSIDSWSGQITPGSTVVTPEPSSLLMLIAGILVLLITATQKAKSL